MRKRYYDDCQWRRAMSKSDRKLVDVWMLDIEVRMLLLAKRCGRPEPRDSGGAS
jgi:hypothetical protein